MLAGWVLICLTHEEDAHARGSCESDLHYSKTQDLSNALRARRRMNHPKTSRCDFSCHPAAACASDFPGGNPRARADATSSNQLHEVQQKHVSHFEMHAKRFPGTAIFVRVTPTFSPRLPRRVSLLEPVFVTSSDGMSLSYIRESCL